MLKKMLRPVGFFLVFSFLLLNFNVPTAQAKMVGTNAVIADQQVVDHERRPDAAQIHEADDHRGGGAEHEYGRMDSRVTLHAGYR